LLDFARAFGAHQIGEYERKNWEAQGGNEKDTDKDIVIEHCVLLQAQGASLLYQYVSSGCVLSSRPEGVWQKLYNE
jgi:hypothetical protein